MVGLTERCGHQLDVLAHVPASNGLRDGSDLGLIPDRKSILCYLKFSRTNNLPHHQSLPEPHHHARANKITVANFPPK